MAYSCFTSYACTRLMCKVQPNFQPKDIQLSFMKYTAQMIIKDLRNNHQEALEICKVKASDRKYQIWERKPLSISLWTQPVFKQKLNYIHSNPVVAGLCSYPADTNILLHLFTLKQTVIGLFSLIIIHKSCAGTLINYYLVW